MHVASEMETSFVGSLIWYKVYPWGQYLVPGSHVVLLRANLSNRKQGTTFRTRQRVCREGLRVGLCRISRPLPNLRPKQYEGLQLLSVAL